MSSLPVYDSGGDDFRCLLDDEDNDSLPPLSTSVIDTALPRLNQGPSRRLRFSNPNFDSPSPSTPRVGPVNENGTAIVNASAQREAEHCHAKMSRPFDHRAKRQLVIVCILTLFFMTGEFVGGILANSVAVMTDAAHMLSDLASFIISLSAIFLAQRRATRRFSFGFHRAEVLGALFSILIIWVLTGVLVYLAVLRVVQKDDKINADFMLATAACGIAFNIVMGAVLHGCGMGHLHSHGGHGHSHGGGDHGHSHDGATHSHSHDPPARSEAAVEDGNPDNASSFRPSRRTRRISLSAYPTEDVAHVNKNKNINVRAAFIHVLGDFVQSIGVFIAALVIKFKPEWYLADPVCTFLFSLLVMFTTITVLRDIFMVLMEGTPTDVDYSGVLLDLKLIEGVQQVHSLHMWSLTMDKAAMSVHLAIDPSSDPLSIMHQAGQMIRQKYNVMYTTVQVEPYDATVIEECKHCTGPE